MVFRMCGLVVSVCLSVASLSPALAGVTFIGSGTSAAGNPVQFQADLAIVSGTLTIDLFNTSPVDSTAAADVLSSFYFDIVDGTSRPTPVYESARGRVWKVISNALDQPYNYTPPASAGGTGTYTLADGIPPHPPHVDSDLKAVKAGDQTWQFLGMNPLAAPFLGFGIGTVGNSGFPGNGFTPSIVGKGSTMIAFSIYKDGNILPVGNLKNEFLVQNHARFTFSHLGAFNEAHIVPRTVFGLGTGPDSVIVAVPEPSALLLVACGAGALGIVKATRRRVSDGKTHRTHAEKQRTSSSWLALMKGGRERLNRPGRL
jgi:hypothetical protein